MDYKSGYLLRAISKWEGQEAGRTPGDKRGYVVIGICPGRVFLDG